MKKTGRKDSQKNAAKIGKPKTAKAVRGGHTA